MSATNNDPLLGWRPIGGEESSFKPHVLTCEEVQAALPGYVGRVSPQSDAVRRQIEDHLAVCETCTQHLVALQKPE